MLQHQQQIIIHLHPHRKNIYFVFIVFNHESLFFRRTARDLAELMNTIDAEQQRLNAHYQTYARTITQSDPFVSYLLKTFF
jgi:hypothetical protein